MQLRGIRRYPVKSFRGEDLAEATVLPWGLEGDRRWMVVDEDSEALTGREVHELLLIRPRLIEDGLVLEADGMDPLELDEPDLHVSTVTVFGTPVPAAWAGREADAWISGIAGRPVRLMFQFDPRSRPVEPMRSQEGDLVSFADAYPLLLASEDSLAMLNDWIAEGPRSDEGPLPMTRFRPNVVVGGGPAFDEDTWSRIRIGEATFRVVSDCARCVMTTIDPDTAHKQMEPIATLARHRKWDGKTWFAVNMIPDNPGVRIRVGDEVEVLERRPAAVAGAA